MRLVADRLVSAPQELLAAGPGASARGLRAAYRLAAAGGPAALPALGGALEEQAAAMEPDMAVGVGLGRIAALCHRSSALYKIY